MELNVKLQVFEGPLDLLLYLLEKNKVNIYDIPIVDITEQYMDYIREMQRQDLNIMSEFLVMAATLLDIKSKMLLPKPPAEDEEEVDPREELVRQLLEYKMYRFMAHELKDRQMDADLLHFKEPTIMKRQNDKLDPVRSKFGKIQKEEISQEEKMVFLENYAKEHAHFSFRGILTAQSSRLEVIVTFLSILELMKAGKILISQEHLFDDIMIDSKIYSN